MSSLAGDCVSFGPFRLFPAARVLERDGAPLALGSRALDVLIALIERAGEIVDHRALIARAWRGLVVDAGNLRVQVTNLRRSLGDGERGARYIANIPGRGYSFVAPLGRGAVEGARAAGRTTVAVSAAHPTPRRFTDGVCRVDLGGVHDPAQVVRTVADAVGIEAARGDVLPALRSFLRASELLLILTNCEQVIDAASALAESIYGGSAPQRAQPERLCA